MKKIYFSHPLRDNVMENTEKIAEIMRRAVAEDQNIVPLSPIHNFSFLNQEKYDVIRSMQMYFELLSLADEMHVYGDWRNCEGCRAEIDFAWCRHIPIQFKGCVSIAAGFRMD